MIVLMVTKIIQLTIVFCGFFVNLISKNVEKNVKMLVILIRRF